MDFVKNHEELYDKTNEHFKDKDCLRERFANTRKLSKSGQVPKKM